MAGYDDYQVTGVVSERAYGQPKAPSPVRDDLSITARVNVIRDRLWRTSAQAEEVGDRVFGQQAEATLHGSAQIRDPEPLAQMLSDCEVALDRLEQRLGRLGMI